MLWVLLATLASLPAAAQTAAVATDAVGPLAPETVVRNERGVSVRAIRLEQPLRLDGQLDESVYRENEPAGGWVQQEPREGQPASEASEAWILFDERNLYIAVRNFDSQPERMVLNELRHDSSNLIQNEQITIILDTFHDRRNGFLFLVNALGGMLEEAFIDERNPSRDWNTVWNAKTGRFDGGWTVEVEVPFKSLRYRPGSGEPWGININRVVKWKNERTFLAPVAASYGVQGVFRVSQAATIVGLDTPPLAKNLELKPYAIGGVTTDRTAKPAFNNQGSRDAGFDVKYGLTRGLTADLTVNTDFAQVEEDEQQVNLTRFSLFFPEKREFFLEGQGIFNFGGQASTAASDTPIMFFSRAIGINAGRPQDILAGGRVTGKQGPWSIGAINIQTREDDATSAPSTNFSVLRLRREVLGRSTVGVLFTDRSESLRALGQRNDLFGADGVFSFWRNVRVNTYAARTRTPVLRGDEWSYRGQFDYAADRYGATLERLKVGQDFNPEVGFMRRAAFTKTSGYLRFSPRPARTRPISRAVRKLYFENTYNYFQTPTGRLESRDYTGSFKAEFQNSDTVTVAYLRNYDLLKRPFRIAPTVALPTGTYDWQQGSLSYALGTQRRINGTLTLSGGSYYNGTQKTVSYKGRIAVVNQLAFEPNVSVNWLDLQQGSFRATLVGTRVTTPLTPRMFASVLLQYNTSSNSYSTNARFRWEYQPGSELFVVYSEGRNTIGTGFPALETRGFVVKITRLFRM